MSTDPSHSVIQERDDAVLVLTINAPEARNSLQAPGVLDGLMAGLECLEHDSTLRAAIISGAGGAFCSGGDLRQLSAGTEAQVRERMMKNAWLYRRIALGDKLVLAAVDGPAYGAGLGLAACCDLVLAGQTAAFCSAFTRVGAMPDAALFWSLPARVGIARARRLMLLANEVRGPEALALGLADEHIPNADAMPAARVLAKQLTDGPARAYGRIKAGLRQSPMSLEQALAFQLDNAPGLFASDDFKEGAAAFFEKRAPKFNRAGSS